MPRRDEIVEQYRRRDELVEKIRSVDADELAYELGNPQISAEYGQHGEYHERNRHREGRLVHVMFHFLGHPGLASKVRR